MHCGVRKLLLGLTTKIHMVSDVRGIPLHFTLSGGNASDISHAQRLLDGVHIPSNRGRPRKRCRWLLADKGYDAESFRQYCDRYRMQPVIPLRDMIGMTFHQTLNTTFDENVGHTPVGMVVGGSLGTMISGCDKKRLKTGFKLIEFELRNQAIKAVSLVQPSGRLVQLFDHGQLGS